MSLTSKTSLKFEQTEDYIAHVKILLDKKGIKHTVNDAGNLSCSTPMGSLQIEHTANQLDIALNSDTQENLYVLQNIILENLETFDARLKDGVSWSNKSYTVGGYPPNLFTTEIIFSERIHPSFHRIRVKTDRAEKFLNTGMHCRLLLPPKEGKPVVWPKVSEDGKTIWPKGDEKPHNPVYTIRSVDTKNSVLEIDIFVHGNGRACTWASNVQIGTRLGIMGPGGGKAPETGCILLAGDETALPAIYRMINESTNDILGQVIIQVEDQNSVLPLPKRTGLEVKWIYRSEPDETSFPDLVEGVRLPDRSDSFYWFAGESEDAAKIRTHFQNVLQLSRDNYYAASYWKRDK